MRRNETSMHVNSESSYKQVPGFDISSNQGSSDRFLAHHGQTESPPSLKSLWTGKRYRFSIQKLFKKVMARKRDLFVHHHASSLLGMHGQINQNHLSFIPTVVVVVVAKGCSFDFRLSRVSYQSMTSKSTVYLKIK